MKKIILLLLLFNLLFSKTILVDKNARNGGFWFCFWCKKITCDSQYNEVYRSIRDALKHSSNGDIIKICPGEYKESNLVVTKNIKIEATKTSKIDDIKIEGGSNYPIFILLYWKSNFKLEGVKLIQKSSKPAIKIGAGSNFYFHNLEIESNGAGIIQDGGIFQNVHFENIFIVSKKDALLSENPSNLLLEDVKFTSKEGMALNFGIPLGKIIIKKKTKNNYFKAKNIAINLGDGVQNYIIQNSKIISIDDDAINVSKANLLKLENLEINAGSGGIWVDRISNDLYISDINITKSKYENIYIEHTNRFNLYNSILENGDYGVYVKYSSNGGEIKNNLFKNSKTLGLKIFDNYLWRGYKVENNCFENSKNINSKDKSALFNKNYYSDYSGSGSYSIPDVPKIDNNPLMKCPFDNSSISILPIVEYRMDELEWNGTKGDVKDNQHNFDATSYNANTTENGKLCRGGDFRLNNWRKPDYLTLNNKILDKKENFTIMAWVKYDKNINQDYLIRGKNGYTNYEIAFKFLNNRRIQLWLKRGYVMFKMENLNDNRFHHFVWTRESNKFCLYEDGKLKGCKVLNSSRYKQPLNISTLTIGESLKAIVDEFKIYDKVLTTSQINSIYQNELNNLNFDGTIRKCSGTIQNAKFKVKEINRNDNNITTKIVNKNFILQLYTEQPFTGTLCSAVIDKNGNLISDWHKTYFMFQTFHNVTYKVVKAYKEAYIKLNWKDGVNLNCPIQNGEERVSTDNFAIRPKNFDISDFPSKSYAGGEFGIIFKSLDANNNLTQNYNENNLTTELKITQKVGCKIGEFKTTIQFHNGKSDNIATYDEVGEFNITIQERENNPFAKVDLDDTPLNQLLIAPKTITILSFPYDINLSTTITPTITFDDYNLDKNFIELNSSIKMLNKNGGVTKNFDNNCFSDELNLSFEVEKNRVEPFKGIFSINGIELNDSKFSTFDNNFSIINFKNGIGDLHIKFNIYKNRAYPVSILDLHFKEGEIFYNKASLSKIEKIDKNSSFYYLRVLPIDINTEEDKSYSKIYILVYDRNRNHFEDEKILYWFLDKNYTKNEVKLLGITKNYHYDENLSKISVTITKENYDYNVSVVNSDKKRVAIIHLDTPSYLWYSKFKEFNKSLDSYCLTHYCLEYHYNKVGVVKEVGSGKFKGSEVKINRKKPTLGIKMYR